MKKLFLVAITILIAFAFSACTKELTKEEMLTQTKGWVLVAATSVPPYETLEGEKFSDLYKNYFYDYEKDDIYYYDKTGALRVDPKKTGELGYQAVTTLGTWVLNYPQLQTKVPGFYDKDVAGAWVMDQVVISELTEDVLTYKYTWTTPDEPPTTSLKRSAKGNETYTFTLTFNNKK